MNQNYLKFDQKLVKKFFKIKNILLKFVKEMFLMKLMKLKKMMALPLKYLLHFGEMQKNFIEKIPTKEKIK